ncbi:hypothetical protein ABZX98_15290 [Streptomyces sp. NPDC002992]|uniref:hypothetical protein n=1 Tax=Streptomyces sp. NPDC002992 TaxID=3154273 RepID=UPI0033BBD216
MKLPITTHQARLGSTEFRVVRPARPLVHAVLIDRDRHLDAYLDRDAAQRIGGLWTLAASSPRSLVHLPMRANRSPSHEPPEGSGRQLDLVLLHHSLQFAPSRWKEVRRRLGPGRPQTVTLPGPGHAKVFRDTARHFLDVARNGPGHVPVHPNYPHYCTELHSNAGILGDAREIHIEYCDQWDS